MRCWLFFILCLLSCSKLFSQSHHVTFQVVTGGKAVAYANVARKGDGQTMADSNGYAHMHLPSGFHQFTISAIGFQNKVVQFHLRSDTSVLVSLVAAEGQLDQVVVSGSMRPVQRSQSPIPIEVYTPAFFKTNPAPNLIESLQNINGLRTQNNCNVCNTMDIRLNGLDGPYTMVLIDGMPIVSGLATVYGLQGIPQALIERVEVVKGPASTLYGSEAVGGLINIITKQPGQDVHPLSVDLMTTGYGETNADLATAFKVGKRVNALAAVNYFHYDRIADKNQDGFTDLSLAKRISLFQKWNWQRKDNRLFSLAGRYLYEDRWGGQNQWRRPFRGGDSVYGESIYTSRWELMGQYQLPTKPKLIFQFSANGHAQNSVYGNQAYLANQRIVFGQLLWYHQAGKHNWLAGAAVRHTFYDDNTPATLSEAGNAPSRVLLPGAFVQNDINFNKRHTLVLGGRVDWHPVHGAVVTPRAAYKLSSADGRTAWRLNVGSGFRVANVFAEDHAALTGARTVVFAEALRPERSWNANLQWSRRMLVAGQNLLLEATAFYTRFSNRILADYDTDPNKIIYANLQGQGIAQGLSFNADWSLPRKARLLLGATLMDVHVNEDGQRTRQLFTERFSGVWTLSVPVAEKWRVDYTGNVYSPMRLPLLGPLDPRPEFSPWYSLQNLQLSYRPSHRFEFYGGLKNLLNFRPDRGLPFLLSRTGDPFDKQVQTGADGAPMATPGNPFALTFDPTYSFAPMQGRRWFFGVRVQW